MRRLVFAAVIAFVLVGMPAQIMPDKQVYRPAPASVPKDKPLPSRSAELEPRELVVEATAYSYTGSRTFTGTWPTRGTIAVDPDVIPLGTRLYVEGYGEGVALDTGGAIQGHRIDVFMETEAEAIQWGRRLVRVRIME